MGSWNFGNDYNTRHSYQLMGEELSSSVVDSIERSIDEELDALEDGALLVENILGLPLDMRICYDKLEVEYGYYEGARFNPRFYIEFDYDENKEKDREKIFDYINDGYLDGNQMYIDDISKYDSYESAIYEFVTDWILLTEPPKPLSDEQVKLVDEYFDKVDKVLNKYLTPYTVGWCASEVTSNG